MGHRSMSQSDGHENIVNSTDSEPLKRSEPKLNKYLTHLHGSLDELIRFQGHGSKVKTAEETWTKNLPKYLPCSRETHWLCFQGEGFEGQCHKNVRRWRQTDRRFVVNDRLVVGLSALFHVDVTFQILVANVSIPLYSCFVSCLVCKSWTRKALKRDTCYHKVCLSDCPSAHLRLNGSGYRNIPHFTR